MQWCRVYGWMDDELLLDELMDVVVHNEKVQVVHVLVVVVVVLNIDQYKDLMVIDPNDSSRYNLEHKVFVLERQGLISDMLF